MALSKTVTTPHGFEVVNAIYRVETLTLTNREKMTFHVRSYVSADKPFFAEQIVDAPYEITGVNPIKQAYLYLKTLPEFEGAEDC